MPPDLDNEFEGNIPSSTEEEEPTFELTLGTLFKLFNLFHPFHPDINRLDNWRISLTKEELISLKDKNATMADLVMRFEHGNEAATELRALLTSLMTSTGVRPPEYDLTKDADNIFVEVWKKYSEKKKAAEAADQS